MPPGAGADGSYRHVGVRRCTPRLRCWLAVYDGFAVTPPIAEMPDTPHIRQLMMPSRWPRTMAAAATPPPPVAVTASPPANSQRYASRRQPLPPKMLTPAPPASRRRQPAVNMYITNRRQPPATPHHHTTPASRLLQAPPTPPPEGGGLTEWSPAHRHRIYRSEISPPTWTLGAWYEYRLHIG